MNINEPSVVPTLNPQLTDLIFWWTGSVAWAIISIALLICVIIAICVAAIQACRRGRAWIMAKLIMSLDERLQMAKIVKKVGYPGNCTSEELNKWLAEVSKEYRKCTQN
jgi:hypothetical protein